MMENQNTDPVLQMAALFIGQVVGFVLAILFDRWVRRRHTR